MKPKNNSLPEVEEGKKSPPQIVNFAKTGSFFMAQNEPSLFYPYYFQKLLSKKQQHYYNSNGHSLLLKNLQVEVVSPIYDCKKLWEEFSPNLTLFDTWDFRLAFLEGYNRTPYFLTLKNSLENIALLPLWYEEDNKQYTWFGSTWQEENKFFVKDELMIPILLAICPSPVILNAISTELSSWAKEVIKLTPDDPKYILSLDNIGSIDDYLSTLKKKKRYNLKRDRRIIESQNPKVIFNRFDDFDTLIDLNITRFEEKGEDTDWEDPRRIETFRRVIDLGNTGESYQTRMLTVVIDNKVAAVDLIATFNGCYYPLKCGYDIKNFPGIGNYVNLLEIEDAISLGMKKMDFLEIGYGWKDKWFEEIPLLQYEKK
ncbi:MAG: GNAT family N-acetyltransferase [Microgenomates group bacterium]